MIYFYFSINFYTYSYFGGLPEYPPSPANATKAGDLYLLISKAWLSSDNLLTLATNQSKDRGSKFKPSYRTFSMHFEHRCLIGLLQRDVKYRENETDVNLSFNSSHFHNIKLHILVIRSCYSYNLLVLYQH